jgi:hypothetical protein
MWQPSPRTDFPACHPRETLVIVGSLGRFVPVTTKLKSLDFSIEGFKELYLDGRRSDACSRQPYLYARGGKRKRRTWELSGRTLSYRSQRLLTGLYFLEGILGRH